MKYRRRPIEVEAVRWTGDNFDEVAEFVNGEAIYQDAESNWVVATPHGAVLADLGDWIVKDVRGQFYPCVDEVFAETYEEAE